MDFELVGKVGDGELAYPMIEYTFALGEEVSRLSEIPYAYETDSKALLYRTFSIKVDTNLQEVIVL